MVQIEPRPATALPTCLFCLLCHCLAILKHLVLFSVVQKQDASVRACERACGHLSELFMHWRK